MTEQRPPFGITRIVSRLTGLEVATLTISVLAIILSYFSFQESRRAADEARRANDLAESQYDSQFQTVWRITASGTTITFASLTENIILQWIRLTFPKTISETRYGAGDGEKFNVKQISSGLIRKYNDEMTKQNNKHMTAINFPIGVESSYTFDGQLLRDYSLYWATFTVKRIDADCSAEVAVSDVIFSTRAVDDETLAVMLERAWSGPKLYSSGPLVMLPEGCANAWVKQ